MVEASSRVRRRSSSRIFHLHFCTFLMEKLDLSILREGYIEGYMNLRLRQNIMLYSFALLFVCDVMSQFKYGLDSSGHI